MPECFIRIITSLILPTSATDNIRLERKFTVFAVTFKNALNNEILAFLETFFIFIIKQRELFPLTHKGVGAGK